MAIVEINDWQVESMRLSAFRADPVLPDGESHWQELTGELPDEIRSQPQQPLITEEGNFSSGRLRVEASHSRIDWRLFPRIEDSSSEFPSLGQFGDVVGDFRGLMLNWLSKCPRVSRIAYGGVLLLSAVSREDAYLKLDQFLPTVEVDPNTSRDFLYRVNRRRESQSGPDALQINRLSTWAAVQITVAGFDLHQSGRIMTYPSPVAQSKHMCRLELDINTIGDYVLEDDKAQLRDLFEELVNLGVEIAVDGDLT